MAKRAAAAGKPPRIAVVVAGMHRSGTSVLTQVLVSLGCDAPKTLMAADEHNASGYWESTRIQELNDALLESAGSSWDDWEPLNPDWLASAAAAEFGERAQALLQDEYGASRLFALKDPRICRLLPFWCDAIRQFGAEPRIAVVLRNPLEVAASLAERDAIPAPIGMLLWLRHVLDAEAESRRASRVFASYDDLLANWEAVVERMGRELDIPWPRRSTLAAVELEERVAPSLRHHVKGGALDDPAVSRWTKSTFAILARKARGEALDSDAEDLDSIRSALDEAATVFGRPVLISTRLGKHNRALQGEVDARGEVIAERERQIESLNQAVRDRDGEIASLESLRNNKDEQIAALDRAVAERDARTDRLVHAVAERDGQVTAATETVRERDRRLAELQNAIAERDAKIAARDERIAGVLTERDTTVDALQAQVIALNTAVATRTDELQGQITARDSVIADRDSQLESVRQAISDRDAVIADRDRELENVRQAITDRDAVIADRDRELDSVRQATTDRDVVIADRDRELESVRQAITDRDAVIADRDHELESVRQAVADRDVVIADRDRELDSVRQAISDRDALIADRDGELESVRRALGDRDVAIAALQHSTSWRLTKPLRWLRTLFGGAAGQEHRKGRAADSARRGGIYYTLRFFWRLLPIGLAGKTRLREEIAGKLPATLQRRALSRAPRSAAHIHSGRLDLADKNYEASRHNAPVPVLFDPDYYLKNNEDVRHAGADPFQHYMEHGALEGRMPIDVAAEELDPLIADLHRFDLETNAAATFDPAIYRTLYPDIAEMDDEALRQHYEEHGQREARVGSKTAFLREICANPREIPIDFRPQEYLSLYPDLADGLAASSPLDVLRHYMQHGRWEPRLHTLRGDEPETAAPPPRRVEETSEQPPLCVLVHVYYPELWPELSQYLANLPLDRHHLYVNLVDSTFTQELLANVRDDFPHARVYISRNIGRDIGGHFQILRNLRLENYRIFCLLHTKKSPHMSAGEAQLWRRKLLTPLLGNRQTAEDNIRLLLEDDTIGILGAARCRYTELNDNPQKYYELLDRLDVPEEARKVDFLSGTMMFVRREVLQRIFDGAGDIDFEPGDDQSVEYHRDGQWAHAVERAFGAVTRDMGYRLEWR